MKKLVFVMLGLLFVGLVSGAQSAHESQCGTSKNLELGELAKVRKELSNCKPTFLKCVQSDKKMSLCKEEYSACKWGKIKELKKENIEVDNRFKTCLSADDEVEMEFEEISFVKKEVSPFCVALQQTQVSLISYFGEAGYKDILKTNGCE